MKVREQEFIAIFSLLKIKGIGLINAQKLVKHFGSATSIYLKTKKELKEHINTKSAIINDIIEKKHFKAAEKELGFIEKNKLNYILISDKDYPILLKNCPDAPLILYYKGAPNWNNNTNISIVGTRKCTPYGLKITQNIISELQPYNVNIISGLAFGIDTQAHKISLEKNIPNFAVLAHSLDTLYPKENKKYVDKIIENGAILTEYSSQDAFRKENFLHRNRIIAGLSAYTLIIESKYKGGAMTTAYYAFNYDRELYAIPGKITDTISQGCNHLIHIQKAQLLFNAKEVNKWFKTKKKKIIQKQLFNPLTEKEKSIVELLQKKDKLQIDQLAYKLDTPTFILMPTLLELEFKGIIKALPGKFYSLY